MSRALTIEEVYQTNKWVPFGAALTFHFLMFAWNPTILSAGAMQVSAPMQVKFIDKLPTLEAPKPLPKPEVKPKPVEKKPVVKKAKKSGLSMSKKAAPVTVSRAKPTPVAKPAPAAPKPFVSKITMPKFTPRSSDEMIAASPAPGMVAAAPVRATRAPGPPAPVLKSRTRGVRAMDINFQLTERSGISAGQRVVAIPVGEESGDIAVLPTAGQILREAPVGKSNQLGYKFKPGTGSGSGELVGKEKIGYHGIARADTYIEGTLEGVPGKGKAGTTVSGKGFEIGGPVGDRKILKKRLPEYPAWAEEKGITAVVKLYFTVKPDGSIRQSMRILQSSGYTELDSLAKDALLGWRFSPTDASSTAEEAWGVITFRFTLA